MKTYTFTEIELKNKIDRLQGTYHNTLDLIDSDILVEELIEGKDPIDIDENIAKDNPELIPDMYDEDAFRFDMERKEHGERWDR